MRWPRCSLFGLSRPFGQTGAAQRSLRSSAQPIGTVLVEYSVCEYAFTAARQLTAAECDRLWPPQWLDWPLAVAMSWAEYAAKHSLAIAASKPSLRRTSSGPTHGCHCTARLRCLQRQRARSCVADSSMAEYVQLPRRAYRGSHTRNRRRRARTHPPARAHTHTNTHRRLRPRFAACQSARHCHACVAIT